MQLLFVATVNQKSEYMIGCITLSIRRHSLVVRVTLLAVAGEAAVDVPDEAVDTAQRAVVEGGAVRGYSYHR